MKYKIKRRILEEIFRFYLLIKRKHMHIQKQETEKKTAMKDKFQSLRQTKNLYTFDVEIQYCRKRNAICR
jgi:hypothetical protein